MPAAARRTATSLLTFGRSSSGRALSLSRTSADRPQLTICDTALPSRWPTRTRPLSESGTSGSEQSWTDGTRPSGCSMPLLLSRVDA
eukprot:9155764-Lingulodinium_polyedra.AAC.1